MPPATSATAQELLDRVVRKDQLDAFDVDGWLEVLRAEVAELPAATVAELGARDDRLRAVLPWFDALAGRAMRIACEHLAVEYPALTAQFRTLLATTVVSYASDLERLRDRVAGSVARHDPGQATATADAVVEAADRALALRGALGDGVLRLAVELGAAVLPAVDAACRDHRLPEDVRRQWTLVRRDLELTAAEPLRLARARFADRLQALDTPALVLDEIHEPTREELIELY